LGASESEDSGCCGLAAAIIPAERDAGAASDREHPSPQRRLATSGRLLTKATMAQRFYLSAGTFALNGPLKGHERTVQTIAAT